MQTLENLNNYFEIFEKIVFEEKGFARVGKDYGISVAAVHARYEFIRMAVCRDLLLLPLTDENRSLIEKLFQESDPARDILTVLRHCKEELFPHYRLIRGKMKYRQMHLDEEQIALEHACNVEALRATCEIMAGDKYAVHMLTSLLK
uniref:Transcriptional regulator n=1 Tax=Burkholderia phage vB_BgluM-SURPRISE13 TaxID=3159457 RepID=A0AAU7PFE6_9VIRU